MPTRLRKIRKQRGSRFHGWGQVGQHRKSGMRGGYGKAGMLKHKWTWVVKYEPDHFGKHGFNSIEPSAVKQWINIGLLDELSRHIHVGGRAKQKVLNLTEMGYDKLLGQGQVKGSYKVVVNRFSESAKRKIEEAGGVIEAKVV